MDPMWTSVIGVGGTLTGVFVGSLLQARNAARQQWRNLVHDDRIALYIDLYATCDQQEAALAGLTEPYSDADARGAVAGYTPSLPLNSRVELLAALSVREAWQELRAALQELWDRLENEGYPSYEGDWIGANTEQLVHAQKKLAEVTLEIRRDMAGPAGPPRGQGLVRRLLRSTVGEHPAVDSA